jgi:lantibiotic modifying enzyme
MLYVLGANDCHYENLIAHGEHLVLIDISGLGSITAQKAPYPLPRWKFINTDEVYLIEERVTLAEQANIPQLNKVALAPQDYEADLIKGFTQMYHFLRKNQQALLDEKELQTSLQFQTVRFIFRATYVYESLLQKTLAPEFLKNGVDRSLEIDILSCTFLNGEEKPTAWPILSAELAAMEQLDIPYFGTTASSHALTVGVSQPITDYLSPIYERFIERLQSLNAQDLTRQVAMIRGSFAARFADNKPLSSIPFPSSQAVVSLTPNQFLDAARQIATEIRARALLDETGKAHWLGLSYVDHTNRFQFQPLGYTLYDGNCGIALFLSALFWITREDIFRYLCSG